MKEIGGYFELELPPADLLSVPNGKLLNSGRHALEYLLKAIGEKVNRVFLPYYTCEVVLEPIRRQNLNYVFYHISPDLEVASYPELKDGDYIVINNYFGIKDRYVSEMVVKYGDRLIVDNAQAWYCPPKTGSHYIYSPRKFFGLPDGGVACHTTDFEIELPEGFSYHRCSHLLKRIDCSPSSGFADFRANSSQLKEEPLTLMSKLTERLLSTINFEWVKTKRRTNFEYLHSALAATNELDLPAMDEFACPMVYPYLNYSSDLRKKLIDNKVFVATYWPNVIDWCGDETTEHKLAKYVIPLPIDQRYDINDMHNILNVIWKSK